MTNFNFNLKRLLNNLIEMRFGLKFEGESGVFWDLTVNLDRVTRDKGHVGRSTLYNWVRRWTNVFFKELFYLGIWQLNDTNTPFDRYLNCSWVDKSQRVRAHPESVVGYQIFRDKLHIQKVLSDCERSWRGVQDYFFRVIKLVLYKIWWILDFISIFKFVNDIFIQL